MAANVITQYMDNSSDDDVSTNSVTSVTFLAETDNINDPDIQGMKVEFTPAKRFVQVSLEGERVCNKSPKVRVRCHLRERKMVSKVGVSKAHIAKTKVLKVGKKVAKAAAKKNVNTPRKLDAIMDPNYTGTLKLLKQIQFDDLMEWRRITFKK